MKTIKGKTKFNLTKIVRFTIAVTLFLILVIISVYFMSRSRDQTENHLNSKKITTQKIETKEQIVHFEVKGERMNFLIKANKQYIGKDSKYHLEGNIEIIDFGKDKSEDIFIYGDKVVYDKELNHFVLTGQGRVTYKDLVITSNLFDYDKKSEIFKSNEGVSFSSSRLRGSAKKFYYSMKEENLTLMDNIDLELTPKSGENLPLLVEGNELEYNRKKKAGEISGNVHLSQGINHASAQALKFYLAEDEENVERISLSGNVKAYLVEREKRESSGQAQDDPTSTGAKREIEADEIDLFAIEGFSRVSHVEAKGKCSYKSIDTSGSSLEIQGEALNFLFDREGELQKFEALKNVKMKEQQENSEERRFVEGEEMTIQGDTNVLQVKGKDNIGARVTSHDSEILAREITIYLENDNLEALGDTKVVFKGKGQRESIGFFSKEKPVFITAQEMRYQGNKERFIFSNNVKVWQEKEMLLANEITLFEKKGNILCSGGVKSVFFHQLKKEKKEDRIEISADKMSFDPENHLISYEKNGSLKARDIKMQAQSIDVILKDEKGEMKMIIAKGSVKIIQKTTEGKGEKALYNMEEEVVTLSGNPVFIDKKKGMIRGDKLTFYIADGRIVVENRGRERSATVIKS
ncbi:MAG: LptA/OstA family protein [Candidatus Aminicenantaceae bacterium]